MARRPLHLTAGLVCAWWAWPRPEATRQRPFCAGLPCPSTVPVHSSSPRPIAPPHSWARPWDSRTVGSTSRDTDPGSVRAPSQVTLEHLELFAVVETDQVIRRDRLANGDCRLLRLYGSGGLSPPLSSFTRAACVDSMSAASSPRGTAFLETNAATSWLVKSILSRAWGNCLSVRMPENSVRGGINS